jgi:drug/metabolite transporter (DMT)-like permease
MSSDRMSEHRRALLAALLVTVLWSSSWVLIRFGLDDEALEPLTFAGLRYGFAALALGTWTCARRPSRAALGRLDRGSWIRIAMLGVVFYAVTQGAQFVAIDNQPAATTSLVLSWTPLLVAGVARSSIDETPSRAQMVGTVLVVGGAAVYFLGDLGSTVVGMVAALVGLAANVASSVLGRSVNRQGKTPPVVVTTVSMSVGAALLLVAGLGLEGVPVVSGRALALIAWLAIVNTALAFTLWNYSLRRLSALESSGLNNTMLIQIAVLAWIFLGEALGLREIAGIALVSMGILLTQLIGFGRPTSSLRSAHGRRMPNGST